MSRVKINERILQGIAENSGGDDVIEKFLKDLVYEEAEHPGQWWYTTVYRRLVDESSAKWEAGDEN